MNQRCVFDLSGYGRIFRRYLKDIGLTDYLDPNSDISVSELDFAYNEITSQIITIFGADVNRFLWELQHGIDLSLLSHIGFFQNLKFQIDRSAPGTPNQSLELFQNKVSEYGLGLLNTIQSKVPLRHDVDYLLEAVAEDYIVIMIISKVNPNV